MNHWETLDDMDNLHSRLNRILASSLSFASKYQTVMAYRVRKAGWTS
jgi:hypothetical protein